MPRRNYLIPTFIRVSWEVAIRKVYWKNLWNTRKALFCLIKLKINIGKEIIYHLARNFIYVPGAPNGWIRVDHLKLSEHDPTASNLYHYPVIIIPSNKKKIRESVQKSSNVNELEIWLSSTVKQSNTWFMVRSLLYCYILFFQEIINDNNSITNNFQLS